MKTRLSPRSNYVTIYGDISVFLMWISAYGERNTFPISIFLTFNNNNVIF